MSSDLNSFTGIGRLTRDPELKTTQSGTSICNFSIASNKTYVSNGEKTEQVSYFNCIAWGKAGEIISQYMKKGNQICIDGSLTQNRWEDKDGNKRDRIEINVDKFQFIGGKSERQQGGLANAVSETFSNPQDTQGFSDIDIPF